MTLQKIKPKVLIIDSSNTLQAFLPINEFYFNTAEDIPSTPKENFDAIILKVEFIRPEYLCSILEIKRRFPTSSIIISLEEANEEFIEEALKLGIDDIFIQNEDSPKRLKRSISCLSSRAKTKHNEKTTRNSHYEIIEKLTAREKEILEELSTGKTNKDISKIIKLSPATVRNHLYEIFKKLKVNNRTKAVSIWLEAINSH